MRILQQSKGHLLACLARYAPIAASCIAAGQECGSTTTTTTIVTWPDVDPYLVQAWVKLYVPVASAFVDDDVAKEALRAGIGTYFGVNASAVTFVNFDTNARRLDDDSATLIDLDNNQDLDSKPVSVWAEHERRLRDLIQVDFTMLGNPYAIFSKIENDFQIIDNLGSAVQDSMTSAKGAGYEVTVYNVYLTPPTTTTGTTSTSTTSTSTTTTSTTTTSTTVLPIIVYATFSYTFVMMRAGITEQDAFDTALALQGMQANVLQSHLEQYLPADMHLYDDGIHPFYELVSAPRVFTSVTVRNKATGGYLDPSTAGEFLQVPTVSETEEEDEVAKKAILGSAVGGGIMVFCCLLCVVGYATGCCSRIAHRLSRRGEELNAAGEKFAADCPGRIAYFIDHLPEMLQKCAMDTRKKAWRCWSRIWAWWEPFFAKNYHSRV